MMKMKMKNKIGYVCFGEVNTPYERLEIKHDHALASLNILDSDIIDAGIVIDDKAYVAADSAIQRLLGQDMDCLILCVAGWIPTHAVIRVTDAFRHTPMILWGLCGWYDGTHIVTTADQAGTTAIRPVLEELDYRFKFVYSVMGESEPISEIASFAVACQAAARLRKARIGTMGYRDMLLYGTQYEGMSLRGQIGVEVEPFEMLEMVQNLDKLDAVKIADGIAFVRKHWVFQKECDDAVISAGVKYALAIGIKIEERGYEAITLNDVDGMKKLLGFPPAMVFMLLDHFHGVQTVPENDVMGSVTQLMVSFATGQTAAYLEYYEFFKDSVLIGVPDFIPEAVTEGETKVLPTAFGLLSATLLNVSKLRTGKVTCSRLIYKKGKYVMHIYTGEAKNPPDWEELGWEKPVPQLPGLEVVLESCTVKEFAQKVSSQHVIICYGDHRETLKNLCGLLNIEVI
jgi:L-fucose isomerase-like protein